MAPSIPPALRTYTAQPTYVNRPVVPGGAEGAMAPPVFGRSVNPISTRGTDYAHIITIGIPGFSVLPTALVNRRTPLGGNSTAVTFFSLIRPWNSCSTYLKKALLRSRIGWPTPVRVMAK